VIAVLVFGGACACRLWTFGISKNVEEDDAISSESVPLHLVSVSKRERLGVLDSIPKASMLSICSAVPSFVLWGILGFGKILS